MSALEEHIDIDVPADLAWDFLHRTESYPRFVEGVREARPEGGNRAHLDVEAGGRTQDLEAEITDRDQGRTMEWQTTSGPDLAGSFSLLPIDSEHTRLQARIEYDPGAVREPFGGKKGFAQATAIERLVRSDLDQFKRLVEQAK
ncbi:MULTISPECIES: SRPBCC family protein [Streptomyces]|uniref:Cyclase n=1 Tax=Streptomyces dengpaensis TaxID=2049881 RepID=A0ABN5I105_9ACTN|nr:MULTISPECIES: SRPBCC family protein [Streptomyces]AVH56506.1 cyclase [Streptomyces dengpaensis]PIB10469.1 cyclase [Streptomyces sp. HG99]